MYPLFYSCSAKEIWVSTSLPLIVEKSQAFELDYEALSVFLRTGDFLGEDTPFRAIRAIPPDCRLRWDGDLHLSGGIRIRGARSISDTDAVHAYEELFSKAIRRRLVSEKATLPISGGRDSRHILLEMCAQHHPPDSTVTMDYPPPRRGEVEVAKTLSEAVGVTHRTLRAAFDNPLIEARKNIETNFCALEHSWALCLSNQLEGRQSFLYDGIAGDVLSAGLFLTEKRLRLFREMKLGELAERILGPEVLTAIISRSLRSKLRREVALERMVRHLKLYREAANPVGSFFFWNRTRRTVSEAAFGLMENAGTVLVPYLDHELWDYLASIPAEMLVDHTFHTRTIQAAYPALAHLPFDSKDTVPVLSSMYRRRAKQLLSFTSGGPTSLLHSPAVLARLIRCLLQPSYYGSMGLSNLLIYLCQLGDLTAGKSPSIRIGSLGR
jgi:asparagine synthetase B (glutamine-hydrolysing)